MVMLLETITMSYSVTSTYTLQPVQVGTEKDCQLTHNIQIQLNLSY